MEAINIGKRFINAIARINSIDWNNIKSSEKISNAILVREYLRRATSFIYSVQVSVKYPFFSAAKAIGKELVIDIGRLCPILENPDNSLYRGLCQFFLEWCTLADAGDSIAIEHEDLYEPIVKLFERGGGRFCIHHGELIIDSAAFPLKYWYSNISAEPMDINDAALDKYDLQQ